MATAALLLALLAPCIPALEEDRPGRGLFSNGKAGVFSPRMEYDEWKPLGRGDPLKNDPTYDYVPPVLERVHYWVDPSKRTPDPPLPNSGVLVLGSTRTEPPRTTKEPTADSRIDTMSLLDPFLKLMDVSQFGLGLAQTTTAYQRPSRPPPPTYPRPAFNKPRIPALQRPPYTMLMPPPPPDQTATSFATSTTTTESIDVVVTSTEKTESNVTTTHPTVFENTENVYKPVAIVMPEENVEPNDIKMDPKHNVPVPEDTSMILPIISMFNTHKKEHEGPAEEKHPHLDHYHHHHHHEPPHGRWKIEKDTGFRPTTVRPVTTTRVHGALTTDPMFKHYKQPSEPIKGPFYLIIEGHSKVKTYGASENPINNLVSSNEIEDRTFSNDYYDEDSEDQGRRRGKKLEYLKEDAEVVHGRPVVEVSASFKAEDEYHALEEAFGKTNGGTSKKRYLANDVREKRSTRRLLSEAEAENSTSTARPVRVTFKKNTTEPAEEVDQEQLGLESLIAFTDDYNSEDIINLLVKEEGQGSGVGAFIGSLFGRSADNNRDEESIDAI